jgi:site-specific recombinase XerD
MANDENALKIQITATSVILPSLPPLVVEAGERASFAWDEFFSGQLRNRHTRAAYLHAVRRFFVWAQLRAGNIREITPGIIGEYFDQHTGSLPTKKLHLAALRAFFDVLVNRHVIVLNPAATVRGERYQAIEGKTPEITIDQARILLKATAGPSPVQLRDRAIIATLIYTAARAGAVAALRLKDFSWDGTQYKLRFLEKGGKERLIPVRHNLQLDLLAYLNCFTSPQQSGDKPLVRSVAGRTGRLTHQPIRNVDICRMVKRRLCDAGLPPQLSPHSFRVATVTDLLTQQVPLEDVQYLAGHSDPRTTRLYDRRQQHVTRNTVDRISI